MTQSTNQSTKNILPFISAIALLFAAMAAIYFIYNQATFSTSDNSLKRHKMGALAALQFPKAETLAPNNTFVDENGAVHNIQEFKGKVVVLNLWATWCAPCVREMPSLARLSGFYDAGNLKIIALNEDKESDNIMAQKKLGELSANKLQFYHDKDMAIVSALQIGGFPTTIIYDRNGKEVARLMANAEWDSVDARSLLDDIIKNNPQK